MEAPQSAKSPVRNIGFRRAPEDYFPPRVALPDHPCETCPTWRRRGDACSVIGTCLASLAASTTLWCHTCPEHPGRAASHTQLALPGIVREAGHANRLHFKALTSELMSSEANGVRLSAVP